MLAAAGCFPVGTHALPAARGVHNLAPGASLPLCSPSLANMAICPLPGLPRFPPLACVPLHSTLLASGVLLQYTAAGGLEGFPPAGATRRESGVSTPCSRRPGRPRLLRSRRIPWVRRFASLLLPHARRALCLPFKQNSNLPNFRPLRLSAMGQPRCLSPANHLLAGSFRPSQKVQSPIQSPVQSPVQSPLHGQVSPGPTS